MGERVEGEDNKPYRILTIEWYRDLETGTFLSKLTIEGESVKEGKKEIVLALSSNETVSMNLLTPGELAKVVNSNSPYSLIINYIINYIVAELSKTILGITKDMSKSIIDSFIVSFIDVMAGVIARGAMVFDANKLKMALSGEKS